MNPNRSLDEFFGTSGDEGSDDGADDPADAAAADGNREAASAERDAEATALADPAADVGAPAVPTYRVVPGDECAACGTAAGRLWRDDDAFVCADCKEW